MQTNLSFIDEVLVKPIPSGDDHIDANFVKAIFVFICWLYQVADQESPPNLEQIFFGNFDEKEYQNLIKLIKHASFEDWDESFYTMIHLVDLYPKLELRPDAYRVMDQFVLVDIPLEEQEIAKHASFPKLKCYKEMLARALMLFSAQHMWYEWTMLCANERPLWVATITKVQIFLSEASSLVEKHKKIDISSPVSRCFGELGRDFHYEASKFWSDLNGQKEFAPFLWQPPRKTAP